MSKKCETLSGKLGAHPMPYSTSVIVFLAILAIAEYLALFLTMRPIRMLIF